MPLTFLWYILFIAVSYLFGALPFMIFIGRIKGRDLGDEPDLHQALWYKVGRGWGMLGFLLDVIKGVLPVLVSFLLNWPVLVATLSGLAGLCGQMWPVFRAENRRRFDGERGNTVSLGILAALCSTYAPALIIIMALIPAAAGFIIRTVGRWKTSGSNLNERLKLGGGQSRSLPLGVIIGFATTPITSALLGQPAEVTLGLSAMVFLLFLRRLTAGLMKDIKGRRDPVRVMLNRLLYDRSEA